MQSILCSRPIQFSSRSSLFLNSVDIVGHHRRNSFSGTKSPTLFYSWPTVSLALPEQRLGGVRARKKKRRSAFRRSSKLIVELASIVASNLKILPQPLDSIIRELSGWEGGGGGFGSRKGFGGGGFDGWRRRRRLNKNFVFIAVLIISALILLLWTDVDINGVKLLLGFLLFGIALNQWLWKRGILDLSMELCMWGLMVCLGLKRVEVQQWSERIRNAQPLKNILRRRTRGGGAFWDLIISGLLTEEANGGEKASIAPDQIHIMGRADHSEAGRRQEAKLGRAAVKQDKSESLSAGIQ